MRLFLASTTSAISREQRDEIFNSSNRPKYCLETFFNGEKICSKVLNDVGNENFILDSGAFSYMNSVQISKEQLINYQEKYINYINKSKVKYFIELDVDTIFGVEFTKKLRKKLENGVNRQCIPVWHKERGIEAYKEMCRNYDYIAIGGLAKRDIKKQEYPLIKKMVDYAYRKDVRVHGLRLYSIKNNKRF